MRIPPFCDRSPRHALSKGIFNHPGARKHADSAALIKRALVGEPDSHFARDLYPSAGNFMEWPASPPGVAASPEAQTREAAIAKRTWTDSLKMAREPMRPAFPPLRAMPRSRAMIG
jgi:hypothetical protein